MTSQTHLRSNRLTQADLSTQLSLLAPAWQAVLRTSEVKGALDGLSAMLAQRLRSEAVIYPAQPFRALESLTPDAVRVVILGQDPYHGAGQAHGLAFSVPDGVACPPSLRNILAEIELEYPDDPAQLVLKPMADSNDLSRWVRQGVLLLNTALTVEDGQPASHAKKGWETVTDALIQTVAKDPNPKVFMLWGAHAQTKQDLLASQPQHLILTCNHPSPLSARRGAQPFIGCGHFKTANAWLLQQNLQVIDWKA
ncbi:MAG: uracil-DNA glycosylase [Alcaligenaceae bacterium]|nr:uracil-DNA glycosylase [Alcaligenaceae bacterium]